MSTPHPTPTTATTSDRIATTLRSLSRDTYVRINDRAEAYRMTGEVTVAPDTHVVRLEDMPDGLYITVRSVITNESCLIVVPNSTDEEDAFMIDSEEQILIDSIQVTDHQPALMSTQTAAEYFETDNLR